MIFVSQARNHFNCDLVSILNFELVVCDACPKQQGPVVASQKLLLSKAVLAMVHFNT